MMLPQQFVRAVIHAEVLIDAALALDISVVAVKINYRMTKTVHRHTIAPKCAGKVGIDCL